MPSVSKAQQRFMGMVHAAQKGSLKDPSPSVARAAESMSKSDAKDFAATKHTNLPDHVKESASYQLGYAMAKEAGILGWAGKQGGKLLNWGKSLAPRFTGQAFGKSIGEAGQLAPGMTRTMMASAPVEGAFNRGWTALKSGLRSGFDPSMKYGQNFRSAAGALGGQASSLERGIYSGARGTADFVRRHPWVSYNAFTMTPAGQMMPGYVDDAVNMVTAPGMVAAGTLANATGLWKNNPFGLSMMDNRHGRSMAQMESDEKYNALQGAVDQYNNQQPPAAAPAPTQPPPTWTQPQQQYPGGMAWGAQNLVNSVME